MQVFRFLLIPFLTLSFATFHPQKPWLCFISAQDHSIMEKLKWLCMPLLTQTLLEWPWRTYFAYLPTRLCMILVSLCVMAVLLGFTQGLLSVQNTFSDILIYCIALIQGFMFEDYYLIHADNFAAYDPLFAALGLFFLFLIFVVYGFAPKEK